MHIGDSEAATIDREHCSEHLGANNSSLCHKQVGYIGLIVTKRAISLTVYNKLVSRALLFGPV